MADDATAVAEPTVAPAETPTAVVDAPPSAIPEAAPAAEPAATPEVESQPPKPPATFTKADLEARVSTEIANQRQKWEAESAKTREQALEEARAQERARYERQAGSRQAVAQTWGEVLQVAGIDPKNLSATHPELAHKLNAAYVANEVWADAERGDALQAMVVKEYEGFPARALAEATAKRTAGDTDGWMRSLIQGAAEHLAVQMTADRTAAIEKAANERVQAEHLAARAAAVTTAPGTPPGTYTSGRPTPEQYATASRAQRAQWAKDGVEVAFPTG